MRVHGGAQAGARVRGLPRLHPHRPQRQPGPPSHRQARRRLGGHPELAGDAALLVSELATNALLHGCLRDRLFRVRIALGATALRVEVTDPRGESVPSPRAAADDEQFGRGLLLVGALADRWGTEPRTVGKIVYAELSIEVGTGRETSGVVGIGHLGAT
ncbi:ATP-binding protein [Streptomyces sp. NPDC051993]|uniref:ATP-binding protein n=1 Tax=unclassified Streptomyces TaxID=2593676 RepID=UPI00343B1A94